MLAPGSKAFKDEVTKRGWTAMTAAEQKTLRKYDTLGRPIDTAAAMKGSQRIQLLPHHADVIDAWTKEGLAGRRAKKSTTGTMIFTNEKLLDHWHATWKAATSRVREGRAKDTQLDHIVPKAHFWMSNKAIISYINGPKNTTLLSTKDNRLKSNRIAHPKTGVPYYPRLSKAVLNNFHYEALYEHHLYEKETGHRFMGSRRITQAMLDDAKKKRSKAAWLARNRQRSPTK